ncbi:MAG: ABC transporter ATP-binding protein/permease [Clostridia bacterium]|nr:ABC transporter ATP-binding protein/permease [Clostridia bacterium]
MLQLKNISKTYSPTNNAVRALRGISLSFRRSDFVSVLGPSGCGKTTLLNIIGGLDHADDGDLVIDGRSTKAFGDRDWDAYRNHSIGFVFQNYHLIPHQSVLQNVELALTLAGVSKKERRARAIEALNEVGLSDQLKKRPSEMSGGQMQRVAIARALVNNPEIILADEPTGALDTETSIQVMEILKKVSEKRLVIMVTHNPELAEKYSTRIIRMLDGEVLSDTNPLTEEEIRLEEEEDKKLNEEKRKIKLPSMSFFTAFGLSLKNLFTKKGRTTLTSFAGSIGIIGIALIYAVSQGTNNYINLLQEETLASYPLTIQATTVDLSTLIKTFMGAGESMGNHDRDNVYSQAILYDMMNAMTNAETTENDLKAFKAYIEKEQSQEDSKLGNALTGVKYTYDYNLNVYTENVDGDIIVSDSEQMLQDLIKNNLGMDMSGMMQLAESSAENNPMMESMMPSSNLWNEMLSADDGGLVSPVLKNQFDVIYGRWPSAYNEVVLIVNEFNEIDDLTLYALGLKTKKEIDKIFMSAMRAEEIVTEQEKWTYEEIVSRDYRVVLGADAYFYDETSNAYVDLRSSEAGLRYLYANATPLKITGIIRESDEATSTMLMGGIAYTKALTEHLINENQKSEIIQKQLSSPEIDVFTGLPFSGDALSEAEKAEALIEYVKGMSVSQKAEAVRDIKSVPDENMVNQIVSQQLDAIDYDTMVNMLVQGAAEAMGMSEEAARGYITQMPESDVRSLCASAMIDQVRMSMEEQARAQLAGAADEQLAAMLDAEIEVWSEAERAKWYDVVVQFSDGTYEANLKALNYVDLSEPSTINLYTSSFESKDVIKENIDEYNEDAPELQKIRYTDYVGIMMSSVTSIINAVTYVLIAFVAISLIVSSIMIGVITLISVQERTKEIGILRAIGASKRNVSSMFNAETMIIGFTSGLLGVLVTYLLCIPINMIIHHLTGIMSLSAHLPIGTAITLVVISVLLTLFAGIIPSRSAARKDPVEALRAE